MEWIDRFDFRLYWTLFPFLISLYYDSFDDFNSFRQYIQFFFTSTMLNVLTCEVYVYSEFLSASQSTFAVISLQCHSLRRDCAESICDACPKCRSSTASWRRKCSGRILTVANIWRSSNITITMK